jgi:hypothetical protein
VDRLTASEERERNRQGPKGLWGPDGGDVFERMARPVEARVEALLRPVHAELQGLHDLAAAASVRDNESVYASNFDMESWGGDVDVGGGRRRSPSPCRRGPPPPPPSTYPAALLPRRLSPDRPDTMSGRQSPLREWTRGLPFESQILRLTNWAVHDPKSGDNDSGSANREDDSLKHPSVSSKPGLGSNSGLPSTDDEIAADEAGSKGQKREDSPRRLAPAASPGPGTASAPSQAPAQTCRRPAAATAEPGGNDVVVLVPAEQRPRASRHAPWRSGGAAAQRSQTHFSPNMHAISDAGEEVGHRGQIRSSTISPPPDLDQHQGAQPATKERGRSTVRDIDVPAAAQSGTSGRRRGSAGTFGAGRRSAVDTARKEGRAQDPGHGDGGRRDRILSPAPGQGISWENCRSQSPSRTAPPPASAGPPSRAASPPRQAPPPRATSPPRPSPQIHATDSPRSARPAPLARSTGSTLPARGSGPRHL